MGVKVVRPMTQLSGKEVGWFARSCGLRSWNLGSAVVGGGKGSIEKLTGGKYFLSPTGQSGS